MQTSVQEKIAIEAKHYGVDPAILVETLRCESSLQHEGVYGDKGKAYGIAQFWKGTFEQFKQEANMPELDYKNEADQIKLTAWAFSKGKEHHWTCFRKVVATNAP